MLIHLSIVSIIFSLNVANSSKSKSEFLKEPLEIVYARQNLSSSRVPKNIPHPTVYRCGEIGKDLVANFVNRNYPENDVAGEECRFRLVINSPHVCQIRLDFVDTELLLPTKGDCLSQTLEVDGTSNIWPTGLVPLCGINNDQHFYLHLQSWSSNTTWVDFRLTTVLVGKPYRFGVWLTQIDCSNFNVLKAPEGCTQYLLGEKGTIKSFNYEGRSYLNGNNYQICIRPAKGVCGIRYEADTGDFNMKKSIIATREIQFKSGVGPNICGLDYLLIPESRDSLQTSTSRKHRLLFLRRPARPSLIIVNTGNPPAPVPAPPPPVQAQSFNSIPTSTQNSLIKKINRVPESKIYNDRYCGGILSPFGGDTVSKPVFAKVRSNLITLQVHTASTVEKKNSRRQSNLNMTTGFKIIYHQLHDCEESETDLVAEPNIVQLLQTFNNNNFPPLFRDHESPNALHTNEVKTVGDGNTTTENPNAEANDDDTIWDYLDDNVDSDEPPEEEEDELYDF